MGKMKKIFNWFDQLSTLTKTVVLVAVAFVPVVNIIVLIWLVARYYGTHRNGIKQHKLVSIPITLSILQGLLFIMFGGLASLTSRSLEYAMLAVSAYCFLFAIGVFMLRPKINITLASFLSLIPLASYVVFSLVSG